MRSKPSFEDSNDNDVVPKPAIDVAEQLHVPQYKEVTLDDKDLRYGAEKELGANGHNLDWCDSVQEDELSIVLSMVSYGFSSILCLLVCYFSLAIILSKHFLNNLYLKHFFMILDRYQI